MQKWRDTATHTKSGLQRFKFGTGIVLSSTNMIPKSTLAVDCHRRRGRRGEEPRARREVWGKIL